MKNWAMEMACWVIVSQNFSWGKKARAANAEDNKKARCFLTKYSYETEKNKRYNDDAVDYDQAYDFFFLRQMICL